jgi:hypothetical protein
MAEGARFSATFSCKFGEKWQRKECIAANKGGYGDDVIVQETSLVTA